ncbi:MAG: TIM barrel protein [Kiritimatiellae bacterium]|nr:TIM barrel protein [Kiritimatiellia bacterium]
MKRSSLFLAVAALVTAGAAQAAELWIGAAEADITPDRPVSLTGQFHVRVGQPSNILSRCKANVLALEARENGQPCDCAILIACDVCYLPKDIQSRFRERVAVRLKGFDANKLFLAATHTHTGPALDQGWYDDLGGAMPPEEYVAFFFDRLAEAAARAWEGRKPGAVAWGLGHAVTGQNRRSVYADGSAAMYGPADKPEFRGLEGGENHTVDFLYFLDAEKKPVATAITVACPSQVDEGLSRLHADYWGDVRDELRRRYGEKYVVLGFCGPAGDLVPRAILRKSAEARMEQLRKLNRRQEVARRIVHAYESTWDVVKGDLRADVPFAHRVERFGLPGRKITDREYEAAKKNYEPLAAKAKLVGGEAARKNWYKRTMSRYEAQKAAEPRHAVELHVLRLGDVAIATNPFELFLDYGMRIQGRSPAGQTILIQLASPVDRSTYLPSERATKGGGYSAVPESSLVGPEGGQMLVEETLGAINRLFVKLEPGVSAYTFRKGTAFEAIEKAKACGAGVIELFLWQKLSPEHPDVTLNQNLSGEHLAALKAKLQMCGVKAVNAYFSDIGKTEAETRKLFEFAKTLGLRGLTGEPPVDRLDLIERLVKESGVQLCFHNHAKNPARPEYRNWDPEYLMGLMKGRDPRMGFSVDTGHIIRSGMDVVAYLKTVQGRVLSVHLKDVQEAKLHSPDMPYGQGIGNIPAVLGELKRQGFNGPAGVEFDHLSEHLDADVRHCLDVIRNHK